jgi:hypothetical protein
MSNYTYASYGVDTSNMPMHNGFTTCIYYESLANSNMTLFRENASTRGHKQDIRNNAWG